jgi:hypothetical protein
MHMTTCSGLTTLALATAVLATASGCGGSKGLSRAELIAKADPICRRANDTLNGSKLNAHNVAQLAPMLAATEHQVSVELAKLTPPSSMAADWKVIIDGFRRAGVGLEKVGAAAKASPPRFGKASKALIEGENELSNGQNVRAVTAQRSGFNDCGKF